MPICIYSYHISNSIFFCLFSRSPGTKDVYEIPTGSHSIRITNKGPSFLGIREKDSTNGFNQRVATPLHQAQYSVAGVTVMYTRLRSGREHIDIKQSIKEPIIVTVSWLDYM